MIKTKLTVSPVVLASVRFLFSMTPILQLDMKNYFQHEDLDEEELPVGFIAKGKSKSFIMVCDVSTKKNDRKRKNK